VVCWSAGNVIVKRLALPGIPVAFFRVVFGTAIYAAVLHLRGGRLDRVTLRRSALTGALFGLQIAAFFVAVKRTTIANATIIGALQPILLLAVASRRFGEIVDRWLVAMLLVAFGGVALVVFGSAASPVWDPVGDLLAVVALLLFAAYFVAAKTARTTLGAFELQTGALVASSVVLAPIALLDDTRLGSPSVAQLLGVVLLVLIPGTGHLLMNWSHRYLRLSRSSMLTLAVPALSTAGAAVFLDESVVVAQVIGMVVVLGILGVIIVRDGG
jgi:drug/metabolite transporter (DMT)-like permease